MVPAGGWNGASVVTAAFLGGLVVGALAWSAHLRRSRRDLFGPSRLQRLAALGYLAGQPGIETARLLTEYVGWEPDSVLRRRGERLLRRMSLYLDQVETQCP